MILGLGSAEPPPKKILRLLTPCIFMSQTQAYGIKGNMYFNLEVVA